jgi:hypothetical protein
MGWLLQASIESVLNRPSVMIVIPGCRSSFSIPLTDVGTLMDNLCRNFGSEPTAVGKPMPKRHADYAAKNAETN